MEVKSLAERQVRVTFWQGPEVSIPQDILPGRILFAEDTGNVWADISFTGGRVQLTNTNKLSRSDTRAVQLKFNGEDDEFLQISGDAVSGSEGTLEAWRTWLNVLSAAEIAEDYLTKVEAIATYISKAAGVAGVPLNDGTGRTLNQILFKKFGSTGKYAAGLLITDAQYAALEEAGEIDDNTVYLVYECNPSVSSITASTVDTHIVITASGDDLSTDELYSWTLNLDDALIETDSIGPVLTLNSTYSAMYNEAGKVRASVSTQGYSSNMFTLKIPIIPYVTFSSSSAFTVSASSTWDGSMEYSTDTENWDEWDGSELSSSATAGVHYIYLRGSNNTIVSGYSSFSFSGLDISVSGNLENLLDYTATTNGQHPEMADNCFAELFSYNTDIVSAVDMLLPATTLSDYCYCGMFNGCTRLVDVPDDLLPANTLTTGCYANMFYACESLTSLPRLPATELADNCYEYMFYGCTDLAVLPQLPARQLSDASYRGMFDSCSQIMLSTTQDSTYTTPYRIPITGTGVSSFGALEYMFDNTSGDWSGEPSINTTYYTSNTVV